jgi:hypothetical protein
MIEITPSTTAATPTVRLAIVTRLSRAFRVRAATCPLLNAYRANVHRAKHPVGSGLELLLCAVPLTAVHSITPFQHQPPFLE